MFTSNNCINGSNYFPSSVQRLPVALLVANNFSLALEFNGAAASGGELARRASLMHLKRASSRGRAH